MRILVVDDEPDLCEILRFNLESEGFIVDCAYSAESALAIIAGGTRYNLILLDVMMERVSGIEMARQLRSSGDSTPVIFLTAMSAESDLLAGFDAGGDDYVTKPFSFPTVLARIRAVMRRSEGRSDADGVDNTLQSDGLFVDIKRKSVSVDGVPVSLTKKEYMILTLLMQNAGHHLTRERILDAVWDNDTYVNDRSVDVHIARLRKKLGRAGNGIVNHTGFGYIFNNQVKGPESYTAIKDKES
ncbi:MAG: response regulator transcription factor [Bacteroidales bacterium]|nr:response regulator transcription factor [Bacteroidales bacterium]